MLVKILGGIDLLGFVILLSGIFGLEPFIQLALFAAGLLLVKGLFIFGGEPLSLIDLASGVTILLSLLFTLPAFLLWILAFLLLAKGIVSFI